jgi:hypothetical protein
MLGSLRFIYRYSVNILRGLLEVYFFFFLLSEMGPLHPGAGGTLNRNPWAWTKYSSMVFIEQPAGVGYSYSTDPSLLDDFNDNRAAHDNVQIIRAFRAKFPEAAAKPYYLASESYGGHYIPHWTYNILNDDANKDLRSSFKGYLVGNPFTSFASGSIAMANVLWGLQLIPFPAWTTFTSSTCELLSHDAYFFSLYLPECFSYLDAIFDYTTALNPCNVAAFPPFLVVISYSLCLIEFF